MSHGENAVRELARRIREAIDGDDYAEFQELSYGGGSKDGRPHVEFFVADSDGVEMTVTVTTDR